jgi:NitT/TauT family transport system substrate-binding protein
VRFNVIQRSAPSWNVFVAADSGAFAAEGLDVEIQQLGVPLATASMMAGEIDLTSLPFDTLVLTQGAGDMVAIGSEAETPIFTLVGGPGVTSAAELRGKIVAAAGPSGTSVGLTRKLAASLGLGPADYQLLNVGGSPERYAALLSGQVGAALMSQPFDLQAIRQGFQPLARSSDVVPDLAFTMFVTTRPWLQTHREVVVRFLRAVIRANGWLYDPANRAAAEDILVRATGVDPELAADIYALYLQKVKVYRPDAAPLPRHLQGSIDMLLELGAIAPPAPRPEQYLDLEPLREAQR